MFFRQPGDKPLSELMMVSLFKHINGTRSQWINVRVRNYDAFIVLHTKFIKVATTQFCRWGTYYVIQISY